MIKIEDLTFRYNETIALNKLNLVIDKGMIGLLGENGAGKTTLMHLISTLRAVKEGKISINNIEIDKNYNKIRKLVGFMPQEFGFYNNFTVYEMLEYICFLENMKKSEIDSKIKKLLDELNIKNKMHKKTKELSGGMKRRLGLACAMINEPEILVVDEPTVGLDPEERIKMRNLLKKYSVGKTVLLSTHIVEDINSICDEVIVVSRGELLFSGKVKDLINNSPDTYEVICPIDQVDEYSKKGTVTDVKYNNENCMIKIASYAPDFKYIKKVDKTLETAYMHLLKNKEGSCL